jgi:hypothetical protein
MSNFLAVATVTATLRRLLQAAVSQDVSGATVTTSRPEDSGAGLPLTGVNLFLYQITPNPDLRNLDLPTRRGDGSVVELPQAAVDLHYMLSFHGDEVTLEPQRLLGSVTRTLHARPLISREQIEDTLADPAFAFLAGSDLADALERIRLVPMGLSLEEQSQIWSGIFTNVPYHLSVVYRVSVVLLTAEEERPSGALPVRRRQLLVKTFRQPVIERVQAVGGRLDPVVVGTDLLLVGERFQADVTRVRLAGQELDPDSISDTEIRFTLDAPTVDPSALRAGVQAVQVIQPFLVGTPPQERAGVESNAAPVVLRPTVVSAAAAGVTADPGGTVSGDIDLQVSPPVGARQRLLLLLNPAPGSAATTAHTFRAPSRTIDTAIPTVAVTGVEPGDYLVRLQVDGAESVLTVDEDPASPTFEQYIAPTVSLVAP